MLSKFENEMIQIVYFRFNDSQFGADLSRTEAIDLVHELAPIYKPIKQIER